MKICFFVSLFVLFVGSFARASAANSPFQDWCAHLSKELHSVKKDRCLLYNWKSEVTSPAGRPIPYIYLGVESKDTKEPKARKVLILGAMHGDEISSVSLVFRWIDVLFKSQESIKNQYLLAPLVNPDGFFANPRTRTNSAGVDLNRNFETKAWNDEALSYWKKRTGKDVRRYPGAKAGSELETKLVQKWIDEFKPDLIISVHAPYGIVDHDGPIIFPNKKAPLPVRALGAFPGSLGRYAGVERKVPVVTVELSAARKIPDVATMESLFDFILKAKF